MKIVVWHNLPSGGGKRALYDQVVGLLEAGHTVEAWCPPTGDQTYLPLGDLIPEHVVPLERSAGNEVGLARLRPVRWNTATRIRAMDRHCRQCADEINRGGFDVLLAHSCMFFRTTAIGRFTMIPRLIYLQEPYRWLYEALPSLPWGALPSPGTAGFTVSYLKHYVKDQIKVRGYRIQVREELADARAFDTILVNSLFSRESVLRAYGLNSSVCYLGIDTSHFAYRRQERETMVIGLGAFVREKNIHLVLQALAQLPAPRPPLVWIGNIADDSYLAEMQAFASSAGVEFVARLRIGDDELIDLLNRAALMVYAPRLEPFGYAALEASSCGVPLVAVAEGGVRETVQDGVSGLLVEHDAAAIACAVMRLLNEPALARRLGEQGHHLVQTQWSLAAAHERLEAQITRTASRARADFRFPEQCTV